MTQQERWRAGSSKAEVEQPSVEPRPGKRRALWLGIISGVIVIPLTSCVGMAFYANWSAERHARQFCDSIEPGSRIADAIARADRENIHHFANDSPIHSFWFPGYVFDQAFCDVSFDGQGRVVSTHAQMQYD